MVCINFLEDQISLSSADDPEATVETLQSTSEDNYHASGDKLISPKIIGNSVSDDGEKDTNAASDDAEKDIAPETSALDNEQSVSFETCGYLLIV